MHVFLLVYCYGAFVQVMSTTVSSALLYTRDSEVFETAHFIEKVDKFFDSLNVSNFTQGKHSRKPFQEPYRDADDARLKVYKFCISV